MHTVEEYWQLLTDVGFTVDTIVLRETVMRFATRAEAEILLRSVLTPLNHLPESKKEDFLNDLFAEFMQSGVVAADGSIALRVGQVDISAFKG